MGLMISSGSELLRYNPASKNIEYSTSQGRSWSTRCSGSSIGNVRCLMQYGSELFLCSDKGVYYSSSSGRSWSLRTSSYKNFIDLQDAGREILATTDDGHLYYSTSSGRSWSRRR